MNSIIVLEPYRKNGTWVFDDAAVGLKAEPFVCGIPEMIDAVLAKRKIANANSGFTLLISPNGMPNSDLHITWRKKELGGNWYRSKKLKMLGWLCPALYKYFPYAPAELYARVEEIKPIIPLTNSAPPVTVEEVEGEFAFDRV